MARSSERGPVRAGEGPPMARLAEEFPARSTVHAYLDLRERHGAPVKVHFVLFGRRRHINQVATIPE
jgi:hypothetical protein